MKAIFFNNNEKTIARVYSEAQRKRLCEMFTMSEQVYTLDQARCSDNARDAEVIFSTWGFPVMEAEEIRRVFPALKAIFYAAGTVQSFARPFIQRGILVFSAWQANGIPVAEFTVAQIVLGAKGYFQHLLPQNVSAKSAKGMYDIRIGLLGLGAIGQEVARRLQDYHCQVYAYDPLAASEKFSELHVEPASMEYIFAQCDIISNHIANLPTTKGIIRREHLFSMQPQAVFINTGRAAQLNAKDLYDVLQERPATIALLDVLDDEKHPEQDPLSSLPNCFISPHIAGSIGNEVHRMADYMIDEYVRWQSGDSLRFEVTEQMLDWMA